MFIQSKVLYKENHITKTEHVWETDSGFQAKVILTEMGHRCGYVHIPKDSVLYGKEYYSYADDSDEMEQVQIEINGISVHGGLTYCAESPKLFKDEGWVFGFDTAHSGDAPDIKAVIESGLDRRYLRNTLGFGLSLNSNMDVIRTKEYMISECNNLSRQLKIIENKVKQGQEDSEA